VTVFPKLSSAVKVTGNATPAVCVLMFANTNWLSAPAENTMLPLVTAVRLVSPAVAVAVSVIVSAFEYTTPEIVTLLPLVVIVPVSVPLRVPPPVALLSVIVVLLVGLEGLPLASCDCTVTLNAVPAVPVVGTDV
jgi:hypothetical protein